MKLESLLPPGSSPSMRGTGGGKGLPIMVLLALLHLAGAGSRLEAAHTIEARESRLDGQAPDFPLLLERALAQGRLNPVTAAFYTLYAVRERERPTPDRTGGAG